MVVYESAEIKLPHEWCRAEFEKDILVVKFAGQLRIGQFQNLAPIPPWFTIW